MSRVLVTGANGFLGKWLVRALVQQGHQVTALLRRPEEDLEFKTLGVTLAKGDVTDLQSLQRAFQGIDAVFHLAGVVAYRRSDRKLMEQVNVQGTANVIAACLENKVDRLVHISSVSAIGASLSPTNILNENSEFNLSKFDFGYFETKRAAELLVLAAIKNRGLNAVILNPSTIYGAGDMEKGSRSTQRKVALGKFPFYTSGGVSIVAVDDVVSGILAAWQKGPKGERYILSGENILIKDLFARIARAAKVPPPGYLMPNWILILLGQMGDLLSAIGVHTSLSSEAARVATLYHWYDNSKARRDLEFNPKPAQSAIEESVNWFTKTGA